MNLPLSKSVSLERLIRADNICDLLTADDLVAIGRRCQEGYENDKSSRQDWEARMAKANKLALQVVDQQTFPWPGAANVKFPLVTVAALQFQARAYPSLISPTDVFKCKVWGNDPDGQKKQRADRVSTHMSWQALEQDPAWEANHDKALLVVPIAGCAFIKTVFDPELRRLVSKLVLPQNLVVNYFTTTLEDSPRYTETYFLKPNEIRTRELDERFRELTDRSKDAVPPRPDAQPAQNAVVDAKDKRQGMWPQQTDDVTPFFTGEQHCWLDLDGDKMEEPYVVTFDIGSGQVRRIVARYLPSGVRFVGGGKLTDYATDDGYDIPKGAKVYSIQPVNMYEKYGFIPAPDGGFYDLGFGQLCGPLNESVNTMLNQLIDLGTMKTLGGGFLGRAFKGRGGPMTFVPGQWYPLDNAGDDLRKSLVPRPDPEMPVVLFQLIGFLVQYAERIASATEIQAGESPGQNMKAETVRTLNENGQRVYTGIYKRLWRCLRDEGRIRYELNALFLEQDEDFEDLTSGQTAMIRPDDYAGPSIAVRPAADPNVVSESQAVQQATMLIQLAQTQPGYNRYQANLRMLRAMKIPAIDEVYPPPTDPQTGKRMPDHPPPVNPKMVDAQAKAQKAQVEALKLKAMLPMEMKESQASIDKIRAEAIKALAQAKGEQVKPLIELIYAHIEAEGKHKDDLLKRIELINDTLETFHAFGEGDQMAGDAGTAGVAGGGGHAGVSGVAKSNGAGASR